MFRYSHLGMLCCMLWLSATAGGSLDADAWPTSDPGVRAAAPVAGRTGWAFELTSVGSAWSEARLRERDRAHEAQIAAYARHYGIGRELSSQIYRTAREERLSPALAFSLVRIESGFDARARGRAGAIGLTQIRLPTARELLPEVTTGDLYSPRMNLRLGFRYLRSLLDRFGQDVPLALAAYNRGPSHVAGMLERGLNPRNAYARKILRGVEPRPAATL